MDPFPGTFFFSFFLDFEVLREGRLGAIKKKKRERGGRGLI